MKTYLSNVIIFFVNDINPFCIIANFTAGIIENNGRKT